jgi:hypothetical protein
MLRSGLLLTFLAAAVPSVPYFELSASFEPAQRPGADAAVAVLFEPLDPDVHVNEVPPPQLRLDLAQTVLEDRQPKPKAEIPAFDPAQARYIDLQKPVRFKVALAKSAPRGRHDVKASVVFFYCSSREAWCRRGNVDVVIPVSVR